MCPRVTKSYKKRVRQKIIRASYREFCKKGYDRANLDDVAKSLGIARGTIYLYFDSKREILEAISSGMLARLSRILSRQDWKTGDTSSTTREFYKETKFGLPKDSEKMTVEMMAESMRNIALKRQRFAESKKMQKIIVEFIKSQFNGRRISSEKEIQDVALGAMALYYGLEILRVQGYTQKEIEDSWSQTLASVVQAIRLENK
jgi:AcrR family transcriptional regulator